MKRKLLLGLAVGLLLFGTIVIANATLVTSLPGGDTYNMPALNYQGNGPQSFGPGIIWTSEWSYSVFGWNNSYGFDTNGNWSSMAMAGTNSSSVTMTFEFCSPVLGVGGFLNYLPNLVRTPQISVYDSLDNLIESYIPTFLTNGEDNTGMFLGFIENEPIRYFRLSGAYIGITDLTTSDGSTVPEPSTMLLLGLGLIGLAGATRRKLKK